MEPAALNSKRFPINGKGDVLFLSVLSRIADGILGISNSIVGFPSGALGLRPIFSNSSNNLAISDPVKIEIIAGGASLAPNLWSFPEPEIDALRTSALSLTALIILTK